MIYCDYQATTPLAPEAREAMLRWLDGPEGTGFGNPHSPHRMGRQADAAVEVARDRVAALFPPGGQVIFTSGATEAINLALRGSAEKDDKRPVAVSAIEHAAVLDTAKALGGRVDILPVNHEGLVSQDALLAANVRLVAVMQVNNEIGTVQPCDRVARRARANDALFLCDAVQGAGKIAPPDADLIAVSAHKLHGPKGIGALWVRDGVKLHPVQTGGGQEAGLRSGTLSPALCAGFGMAAKLAVEQRDDDLLHIERLWEAARTLFAGWTLNGSASNRWHGNLNLRRDGLDVARLMSEVRQVAFSAGSACASGSGRPSHVLQAIGLSEVEARQSIRLGFGRYTKMTELEQAANMINDAAAQQG
ncbi:cysteine desulfurase [Altericroceibacterium spongiae]|uniref:Cysteine desulfurase n=1 Tax=Altericroceibacterium spongiae TaxID=2320269 RepID=A0A420EMU9_9SPHN|nr:cysteine desulfurase family protein [Altericroceibacterium spongiae]RKF21926.1 cysteine desulfurase [Altericroceibacterium spongiae]